MSEENKGFVYRTLHAFSEHEGAAVCTGIFIIALGCIGHELYTTKKQTELEKVRIQSGLELKVGDYNGNNILDKFYEINGKKVPVEVDGKATEEYFLNK